jgi:hypothetical protein
MAAESRATRRADGWTPDPSDLKAIVRYYRDRPVELMDALGFTLADTQQQILHACQQHDRILVISGNGTGKTAGAMMAQYWYFTTRYNALGLTTSGNYGVLNDTSWPFLQTIHNRAMAAFPAIADEFHAKQSPPRIDCESSPEWFLRFRSPSYPKNLEGRHARRAFVVIDEADKPDVGSSHFGAATSTASSGDDVVIAIANPPEDKSNVVYEKWQSDRWHTIEFSSFDSHNVKRELDGLPADDDRHRIPGLVNLDLVVDDYDAWNGYDWPGAEQAQHAVVMDDQGRRVARDDHTRDLDPRWYRKRLGVMPPAGQGVLRPFYEGHVDAGVQRYRAAVDDGRLPVRPGRDAAAQMGTDIARDGGDRTVTITRYTDPQVLDVQVDTRPRDHERNYDVLTDADDEVERRGAWVIDATGEGSGVADRIRAHRAHVRRFDAGENAHADDRWYDRATEAYVDLGTWLKDGGMIPPNTDVERELREASRVMTLDERALRGGTTLKANGKDALQKSMHLGRSPDVLDASALATYKAFDADFEVPDVGGVVG